MARHTAADCYERRGRRGYLFIIGDEMADPGQDWPGIFEEMLGAPVVLRSYGPTSAGMRGYQRHGPASFGQRRVLPDADGRAGRCLVDKLPDPAHAVDGRLGLDGSAHPR